MAMIELANATRSQRNTTRDYLATIAKKSEAYSFYQIISDPRYTAAVVNPANPPHEIAANNFHERLSMSAEYRLLSFERSHIRLVTNKGLVSAEMLNVTHMNPIALPHALQQETLHETDDEAYSHDPRAYTFLPQIIKDHWGRLNAKVRQSALHHMTQHLNIQTSAWPHIQKPNPHTHFSHGIPRDFPYIPVCLDGMRPADLMDLLVSSRLTRADFNRIMPAQEAEDTLRLRSTTETQHNNKTPRSR